MELEFAKKVLLVYDNPDVLDQVKTVFENESKNIEIVSISSPSKALNILEKGDFDAIVSEYHISKKAGIELLKKVRKEKEIEIPFILFTGEKEQEVFLKGLEDGANRVLQKGEDIKLACKTLHQALKQEISHYERKQELDRLRDDKINRNIKVFDL